MAHTNKKKKVHQKTKKFRQNHRLTDLIILPKTLAKYKEMLAKFFLFLKVWDIAMSEIKSVVTLDTHLAEYIEEL